MKNRILFFDFGFGGHVMEWMNHFYKAATQDSEADFFFVFREDEFLKYSPLMTWDKVANISIILMPLNYVSLSSKGSYLVKIFYRNYLLMKYIRQTKANKVFLINLEQFMPLLGLSCYRKTEVS
ncbi:MAG: hypothetical protein Q8909_12140, partial [Bacteroidota bacterium]|nr:hypothetical protein [Bacteroidota bacterium]